MDADGGGFGGRLRACRGTAGLSQQELAGRSGLSLRTISDLERGRTRWPYRDSLYRLADALELRGPARTEFIAAADRRLASAAAPGNGASSVDGTGPGGARPSGASLGGASLGGASLGGASLGGASLGGASQAAGLAVPRQLPAAVPGFAGRRDHLAALSRVLRQPGGTAVISAIGGMAGVGKTALAVQWAHQVAAEFPDGQLFVNLRGFDPSEIPMTWSEAVRTLLDALGVPPDRLPATAEARLGMYRSLLAGKRMLVVLDNARDVAQVRPLLPGSPTCRVVVTSRNQLTGLAALEAARPLALDVLTEAEARQLLGHRLGDERLSSDPAAVARIISSCAHLPLALCVIAARAAMRQELPLARIAADMAGQHDLDAFADESDPAADVRGAFSWSYRQLEPQAATVFRLIGLHPGPSLEPRAVAALTGTTTRQAGHELDALTRAGMVSHAWPPRYGLHDLLRSYAAELASAEETEDARQAALTRLIGFYLHAASVAMDAAFPAERHRRPSVPRPAGGSVDFTAAADALAWLDSQRGDLVAVARYAAEHGWPEQAIRLGSVLYRYLDHDAQFSDAIVVHSSACRAARGIGDQAAEANALHNIGVVGLRQGRYQQAADYLDQALALQRHTTDLAGQARTLANLGLAELLLGRPEQAVEYTRQSLALHRQLGDRIGEARALGNLGFAALRQGRYLAATGFLTQSLAASGDTGDRAGQARVLANLGEVELRQGRNQQAASYLRSALDGFRQLGDRTSEADTMASLGITELRRGNHAEATGHLRRALDIFREAGDVARQALALNGIAEVLLVMGRPAQARTRHAAALKLASEAGEKYEQARAHAGLAAACEASGAGAQARRHWTEALALYSDVGAPEANLIRTRLSAMARQH
jgi:tetratricopeptide (TPR) repeat protein/DNA-binding XRE family transcriptional regulator